MNNGLRALFARLAVSKDTATPPAASASTAVLPGRGEVLKVVNCGACNHRFEADALGDPGEVCCDVCARITCPKCRFVFFIALPPYEDQPPAFFKARRHSHAH